MCTTLLSYLRHVHILTLYICSRCISQHVYACKDGVALVSALTQDVNMVICIYGTLSVSHLLRRGFKMGLATASTLGMFILLSHG